MYDNTRIMTILGTQYLFCVTIRDAGTYGARGAIAPLPFLAGGQGGQRCPFPKTITLTKKVTSKVGARSL